MNSSAPNSDFANASSLKEAAQPFSAALETTTCGEVYERFGDDSELIAVAVTRDQVPIGLVERSAFLVTLASPYGRALYARKPITALMDQTALIVDVSTDIAPLADLVLSSKSPHAMRAFIVTSGSKYLGIASGEDVLRLTLFEMRYQAKELIDAKHMAETASRAKSQFLAAMSHELRTPLNVLLGFSQLIQKMPDTPEFYPKAVEYAGDVYSSGRHLLELINDVLDIAKIEAGKMSLDIQDLCLKDEIVPVIRRFSQQAASDNIAISFESIESDLICLADQRAVRQILENLIGNAVKFTRKGGQITVSLDRSGNSAAISIQDTGVGIAETDISRLFQPFERTDNSYSRRSEGTGLGLYMARKLVEAHNGTLSVTSKLGIGSCFTVRIPLANSDQLDAKHFPSLPASMLTPQGVDSNSSKQV